MRARSIIMLLGAILGALVWASPAFAHDDPDHEPVTPTTPVPPGAVSIGDGFAFTGAVVYPPAEAPTTTWDADRTAVFVQSWLGESIFGTPNVQDPPPELPVHRIDITGTWAFTPGILTVYYATDDVTAWVGLPADQTATPAPARTPEPSGWFVGDPRVIGAFNGTEGLIQTAGVAAATTTTTEPGVAPEEAVGPSSDDSGSEPPWDLIALGAVALAGGGGLVLRRRRPQPADAPAD